MLIAVADTETTGFPRNDYSSPENCYLASLTLLLFDTELNRVQASFNTMIKPDGWEMPVEAGAVNGLTTDMLDQFGIPLAQALVVTASLLEPAELFIAHNAPFDVKVMASAFYRADLLDQLDDMLSMETYCTQRESKQIVQAKNKNDKIKMPKLTEAYKYFFDVELDNAHSANADTVACLEIYLAIQRHHAELAEGTDEGGDVTTNDEGVSL